MLREVRGDDPAACCWMARFFPLSLWSFLCYSEFCVNWFGTKEKFSSFPPAPVSFLLALWTELAYQEVSEVSEVAQGKRWYCMLKEWSMIIPFTARAVSEMKRYCALLKHIFRWLTLIWESIKILTWKFSYFYEIWFIL